MIKDPDRHFSKKTHTSNHCDYSAKFFPKESCASPVWKGCGSLMGGGKSLGWGLWVYSQHNFLFSLFLLLLLAVVTMWPDDSCSYHHVTRCLLLLPPRDQMTPAPGCGYNVTRWRLLLSPCLPSLLPCPLYCNELYSGPTEQNKRCLLSVAFVGYFITATGKGPGTSKHMKRRLMLHWSSENRN